MTVKKLFLQSSEIVYNGMLDVIDSQSGKEIYGDCEKKKLHFIVRMFEKTWTLKFTVAAVDRTRCESALEVMEAEDAEEEIQKELRLLSDNVLRREYAILEAMMLIGTPLETKYDKKGDETV